MTKENITVWLAERQSYNSDDGHFETIESLVFADRDSVLAAYTGLPYSEDRKDGTLTIILNADSSVEDERGLRSSEKSDYVQAKPVDIITYRAQDQFVVTKRVRYTYDAKEYYDTPAGSVGMATEAVPPRAALDVRYHGGATVVKLSEEESVLIRLNPLYKD
jgi:hypothetical protein